VASEQMIIMHTIGRKWTSGVSIAGLYLVSSLISGPHSPPIKRCCLSPVRFRTSNI
jgi:hypothetical protein